MTMARPDAPARRAPVAREDDRRLARRSLALAAVCAAAVALACLLALTATPPRAAHAATAPLDPTRTGSLTVTLHDVDGAPAGGELALYHVASAVADDTGWHLAWDGAFASMGDDLASKTGALTAAYANSLAQRLAPLVAGRAADQTGTAGADGTVSFADLAVGMYLVVQTSAEDGLEPASPFVVTVPVEDATTGALAYAVDASPKVAAAARAEGPSPAAPQAATQAPPTTAGGQLPKTGQDWTPILPIAAAGVALLLAGGRLLRRDRADARAAAGRGIADGRRA